MRKLMDECRILKANLSLYEGYEVGSVAGIELIKCGLTAMATLKNQLRLTDKTTVVKWDNLNISKIFKEIEHYCNESRNYVRENIRVSG